MLCEIFEYSDYIPYSELLQTTEWHEKRSCILLRDNNKCTSCDAPPTVNHYDQKLNKVVYIRFGDEEKVILKNGDVIFVPKVHVSAKQFSLHVHHKFYVENRLPWEYQDDELITLCNWCHQDLHDREDIIVYSEDMLRRLMYDACDRCGGAGWFPEYKHVQGGICFKCGGSRYSLPGVKVKKNK